MDEKPYYDDYKRSPPSAAKLRDCSSPHEVQTSEPGINVQEQNWLLPGAYWGAGAVMAASGAYLAMTGNYFGMILVAVFVVRVLVKLATGK
jgi:hypothetical protein